MRIVIFVIMILGELLLGLKAAGTGSPFWIIFAIALIYVFICVFPFCRKRECLWTFVLAAPALLPFNIYLYLTFRYLNFLEDYPKIFCQFEGTSEICILLCIEMLVLMLISKIIWKKQYPFGR